MVFLKKAIIFFDCIKDRIIGEGGEGLERGIICDKPPDRLYPVPFLQSFPNVLFRMT